MPIHRLVIVSDTHVPQRARALPEELWTAIEEADLVVHAGDWNAVPILDEIESRSRHLIGVHGNNDGPPLRARLPETAEFTLDGLHFAVVHETGPAQNREKRCDDRFPDRNVLIFGHSHIPWDTTTPNGLRLLNPGSPTDRRRQPHATYLTVSVTKGVLAEVELHPLPARPRKIR